MKAAICQPQMGKEALLGLLSAKSEGERAFVFDAAREARHRAFGNKVFLYGFLYLSTHCRNALFASTGGAIHPLNVTASRSGKCSKRPGASRRMGYTCSI